MISMKLLLKWRREALGHKIFQEVPGSSVGALSQISTSKDYIEKVLRLTQELIDQQLVK